MSIKLVAGRRERLGTSADISLNTMEAGMQAATQTLSISKTTLWTGRIISALVGTFLLFDSVIKVLQLAPAVEGTTQLGYPAHLVMGIGLLQLVCLALYAIPRTSVLGALLLTSYLGGAVASQVRIGAGLFTVAFAVIVGALVWGGLFLRDSRLRALLPLRS